MELLILMDRLTKLTKPEFVREYNNWQTKFEHTIKKRSEHKDGTKPYRHKSLRGAMNSINTFLPYLFTYQLPDCEDMPNTNNKIEGVFTDLNKNLNNHAGLSEDGRKRFIDGVFLALGSKSANQNSSEPEPTAASH